MSDQKIPPRLAAAKLVQAVNMAYDMYVGDDNVKVVAVSAGQVVMLTRLLPQISTALTLQKTQREVSLKALKVLLAMALSQNGCEELLAHPNAPGEIVPWLLSITQLLDTAFTPLALDVLREVVGCEEGCRQVIDATKGTGDFTGPTLVKSFIKTLSIGLHSLNSDEIVEVAGEILVRIGKAQKTWHYLNVIEFPVFKSLIYGLALRLMHQSAAITTHVIEFFLQLCEKEMLQVKMQDPACRLEVRAVITGLGLLMFRSPAVAARAVAILYTWTFRPSGLTCIVEAQVEFGQLINGLIVVGSNFKQPKFEKVVGQVANTLDNLFGHTEFSRWTFERPAPLQAIVQLVVQGLNSEEESVAGHFAELLHTACYIPSCREGLLRLSSDMISDMLHALTQAIRVHGLEIKKPVVGVLFNLTILDGWTKKIVEWLVGTRCNNDQTGLLCLVSLLEMSNCGDADAMKQAVDVLTSLVQFGGAEVFGSEEGMTLLVASLQACIGQGDQLWRGEDATTLLAVALCWSKFHKVITRALMHRDVPLWEKSVHGLANVMLGKNSIAADAALGILYNLLEVDVGGFELLSEDAVKALCHALRCGPCFEAQQAKLVGFKCIGLLISSETASEHVSAWIEGESEEVCEQLCVTAAELLALQDDNSIAYISEVMVFLGTTVGHKLVATKEAAEELVPPLLDLSEHDRFQLNATTVLGTLSIVPKFQEVEPELFGKVILSQASALQGTEDMQTVAAEALAGNLDDGSWREQCQAWIPAHPEAFMTCLMLAMSVTIHATVEETSQVAADLVQFLGNCRSGMGTILAQEHATLEACVLAIVYMTQCEGRPAFQRNGVQLMLRMFQMGDLKAVVGKKLLKVMLTALMSLMNPSQDRLHSELKEGGDVELATLSGFDPDLIRTTGECINTLCDKIDLLGMEEDISRRGVSVVVWVLENADGHVLKATVENLVNLVTQEDLFEAPQSVVEILLEGLCNLCANSSPDYADIGHYTLFSLQYRDAFLDLPTTFIVPCVTITRELLFNKDKRKQKMAAEVINNMAASEKLMRQDGELIHSLLSGLTITLGSEDDFVAEFSSATAALIQERSQSLQASVDVPNEVLANIAQQLRSVDPMIVGQAVESTNRLAKTFNVANADPVALENVIFGLSKTIEDKGPAARAATKALGCIAMSADGLKVPRAVLSVSLQHLTTTLLGGAREGALAAVSISNLTKCNDWLDTLTAHFRAEDMDYDRLLCNLSLLLEDKNNTTRTAATTILEFLVLVSGLSESRVEVLLSALAATLFNKEVPDVNCHTAALYVCKVYLEKEGPEALNSISLTASEDIIEGMVPFADSALFAQREYVQTSIRTIVTTVLGRGIVSKVLAGPAGEKHPGAMAAVLGILLDIHGPENFMTLNPKMLMTTSEVLMEHLQVADEAERTRERDLVHGMLFRLLESTPGAAFTLEVLINGKDPVHSSEGIDVLSKYMEDHGSKDILADANTFLKILNMLGGAALIDAKRANRCFELASQICRYGSVNGYSLACLESLMGSRDATHSGLAAYMADKWLISDEQIRQCNKLRHTVIDKFAQDVSDWAKADTGDGMMCTSLIRLVGHLTHCNNIMVKCMPLWLKSEHPAVAGVAMKALRIWLGRRSMEDLLGQYQDAVEYSILAFARHAKHDAFVDKAVDYIESLMTTEAGRNCLLDQDDIVLPLIMTRIAFWLQSPKAAVGQATSRMFHGHWRPFVERMCKWFETGTPEPEEEAGPKGFLSTMTGLFAGIGKDKDKDEETHALHKGEALSALQARRLILDMVGAARKQIHSADSVISSSALEMLSVLCQTDGQWIMLLTAMPGFGQDLCKVAELMADGSDQDCIYAQEVLVQLTATADGRYQLARLLQEDKAVKMLRALELRTSAEHETVKQKANTAFFNLTMEGDHTWQLWLSQIDPVLGARGSTNKERAAQYSGGI